MLASSTLRAVKYVGTVTSQQFLHGIIAGNRQDWVFGIDKI
jgi:hypothetical protein